VGRRFSAGWLAALVAVALLSTIVLVALPIRSCPTCKGIAKKMVDPKTGTVDTRIGCPECGDRGSVTEPQRWGGPLVPPQVTRLLQCWRPERQKDFIPSLKQVAELSGRDPAEILGTKTFGGDWSGAAVFLRSEGRVFVLVSLWGHHPRWNGLEGLLLLGMDGRVLDYFHGAGASGWFLAKEIPVEPSKDGTVAVLTARAILSPDASADDPVKVELEGAGRSFPAQAGARDKCWLVQVKNGRFEFVTLPKDGKP
jgi:hypothetical protein